MTTPVKPPFTPPAPAQPYVAGRATGRDLARRLLDLDGHPEHMQVYSGAMPGTPMNAGDRATWLIGYAYGVMSGTPVAQPGKDAAWLTDALADVSNLLNTGDIFKALLIVHVLLADLGRPTVNGVVT